MKILIATSIFKPELGGPATYAAELGRRFHATGHPVKVITYSDKAHYDFDKDFIFPLVRIVRSNKKFITSVKYFLAVMREVRYYDFIYVLDGFSVQIPVLLAALVRRKKYVLRIGADALWENYIRDNISPVPLKVFYKNKLYKKYWISHIFLKYILCKASVVIFTSDDRRELYQTYYKSLPKNTSTICNPLPENKFGTLIRSYKQAQSIPDKEIVYAGKFTKTKNVESLVKAFARLADPTFKLLLIGEGPTEPLLHNLVQELGIQERVRFMPLLSQVELYRRISNCYYVVLPSWTDISPNQIYECMTMGIPFLITKENYLSINKYNFTKIDPTSLNDIVEKMNMLLDKKEYDTFAHSLSLLTYTYTWNDAIVDHIKVLRSI